MENEIRARFPISAISAFQSELCVAHSADHIEDKVVDSREAKDGDSIRRRRECLECGRRFTSYERIDEIPYMVVKKDGTRESFDRNKVLVRPVACMPRNGRSRCRSSKTSSTRSKRMSRIRLDRELPTSEIGKIIMRRLKSLDKVAYVRFASVYLEFEDVSAFMTELKDLVSSRERTLPKRRKRQSNYCFARPDAITRHRPTWCFLEESMKNNRTSTRSP